MANASQYGLHPLGPSGISMDTSKAMAILGFSPSQTFDSTSTDEINKAFMKKLHVFLKPLPKNKNEEKMKKAEDARRQDDSSRGVVILYTGKSFSEALILATTNPQYNKRFSLNYKFNT